MNSETQVLIVGAGPTGLAAAAVLTQLGVKVRIIDKNTERSDKSKALGVQAGTLECLEKALSPELVQKMVARGREAHEAWLHLNDNEPVIVDLDSIPSSYAYVLILEQSETERFLEEHLKDLGVVVERKTELIETVDQGSEVVSKIRIASGQTEEVQSKFVIGCDGAHSAVRRLLGIPFEGQAYEGDFILGDVKLDWPWPYESVQTFITHRGVIASFPMQGDRRYRLVLIPREADRAKAASGDSKSRDIGPDEFKAIVSYLSGDQIRILEATWLTRFSVHHRMVKNFQKGRHFLAGDAAHIHSPAGGQGMNTGIQDALNLGFKLARVLSGQSSLRSLKAYEKERMPVAQDVLRGTDFVFKLALMTETPTVRWARQHVFPRVARLKWLQRRVALAVSEVEIARREIAGYQKT